MIQIVKKIAPVLLQLADSILLITDKQYSQKSILLNGNTIGAHTRHVIELFQCLLFGYNTGFVNYDLRKRDVDIQTNNALAYKILLAIVHDIQLPNKMLILQDFGMNDVKEECIIETNFYRELIYNFEHTIHHMAIIRIAINEMCFIDLPDNFGVAPSTTQYLSTCVQ